MCDRFNLSIWEPMNIKSNFSLTQLEYVLAVHRSGHFAKAAKSCLVTQPTLSMQIQKLEESIGAVLFDRSKKPILLTDAGKKLLPIIQNVVDEAKKIPDLIQSQASGILDGELTVGIIPTIAPYLLPLLLPVLQRNYPGLELKIQELQTSKIVESLQSDEIDVGILAIPLKIPKILETPLYYETFSVLCNKDHPLSKQNKVKYSALEATDIWLLEEGHCLRHQVLDVCSIKQRKGIKKRYQFESGSLETLKNIVNSFGGYTLLPLLATQTKGKECVLVDFERPIPSRQIGLVHRRQQHKSKLIQALADSILAGLPDTIKNIKTKNLDVLSID
jgi:LysR family hydrogen peroxide-inducible transcriptional activator